MVDYPKLAAACSMVSFVGLLIVVSLFYVL
jgi:hypothetical protein